MLEDIIKKLDDSYAVKLTKEMICIPSVTREEEAFSLYIKDKLESYGMETELQYAADRRPNVYGAMQGDEPGRRLNYNAHTDTVPVGDDWKTDPFKAKVIARARPNTPRSFLHYLLRSHTMVNLLVSTIYLYFL